MVEAQEIQFIVDRLNEPPFGMGLSLVAFDEKTPFELLEIVNALMAQLSADHRVDLRDETPEATANRMLDFLRVLNYKLVRKLAL
jgi:intraflagellar transport protein 81